MEQFLQAVCIISC